MVNIFSLEIIIPISLVILILIAVLWYLYSKNKKIVSKIISEKQRFSRYSQGIENLKQLPGKPEQDLKVLNKYLRAFFKEYLNLDTNKTYLELADHFKKEKKGEYEKLSKLMANVNYKGQKTSENIKRAIGIFEKIIKDY